MVIFQDNGGKEKIFQIENIFLILLGTMQIYKDKELTTTKMKFSVPKTILTGGIPVWKEVNEKTKDISIKTERFIRLYEQTSLEPSVEIWQNNFSYSFLGQKMALSSLANINATAAELRNIFHHAVFDDCLTKPLGENTSLVLANDNTEITCKLIYLYHKAAGNLDPLA